MKILPNQKVMMKTFSTCQRCAEERGVKAQAMITPILLLLGFAANKKKQGTVKLGFRDKIRKGSTVLLHTKNKQESHEQSHHTQIYQKSKNKNKSRTNSPPATGSISFEAISEGNEAWSEIPQIRGMKNYTRFILESQARP